MRAIVAKSFSGYGGLRQTEIPRPQPTRDRVLILIVNGSVRPIVERVYPLGEADEALRHLIEDRPFGKVVLTG